MKTNSDPLIKQEVRPDNTKEEPHTERYPSSSTTKEDISKTVSEIKQQNDIKY